MKHRARNSPNNRTRDTDTSVEGAILGANPGYGKPAIRATDVPWTSRRYAACPRNGWPDSRSHGPFQYRRQVCAYPASSTEASSCAIKCAAPQRLGLRATLQQYHHWQNPHSKVLPRKRAQRQNPRTISALTRAEHRTAGARDLHLGGWRPGCRSVRRFWGHLGTSHKGRGKGVLREFGGAPALPNKPISRMYALPRPPTRAPPTGLVHVMGAWVTTRQTTTTQFIQLGKFVPSGAPGLPKQAYFTQWTTKQAYFT